jgi:SAM-dependent MidA family methyltransferase
MAAEFEPPSENAVLKERIIQRIQAENGIPFREFMAMALYEPALGYYCARREKIGRQGDYLTSPEVGPLYGAMLGRQLFHMWVAMDRPGRFQAVEAGAGTGALCLDILRWARRAAPEFAAAITYTIVEASPALQERQKETLESAGLAACVRWQESLPQVAAGCIFSNELLDSMPVHRVAVQRGRLYEVFVTWDGSGFREELREPSTPAIEAYFQELGLRPQEGCRAEVNLDAVRWVRQAATALRRGFLLTIDYGYEAPELYASWREGGTLMCFYRHNPSTDPYVRLGRQDITAHVDFTSVRRAGEEAGLTTLGILTQCELLMNLGIQEAMLPPGEGEAGLEDYYARRRQALELIDPAGLGRIKVLVQCRGLGRPRLPGVWPPAAQGR